MWRAVAAGVSVVLAAASGVATALVTSHSSIGLWVALGVLVMTGAGLQVAVAAGDRRRSSPRVVASAAGAVAVGGSAGEIITRAHGGHGPAVVANAGDVVAAGPGAVAVGGDAGGPVSTEVTGPGGPGAP